MTTPQPLPAPSSPKPNRFSVWAPGGSQAPRPRPPSLLTHLRVKLGMAGLAEREAYEHAIWQSGKDPVGGRLALRALKTLGVLAVVGALLGMVWLQRRPAPAPVSAQPRQEPEDSKGMEVYFVIENGPGAQNEPVRLIGGRIGMKSDERP